MPETSIIMTSYNYENYIGEAIESVLSQTYKDWELIIIDDGSRDNSLDVINKYTKKYPEKIFLFSHYENKNLGLKASLELGFTKIKGEFTAFLESDDAWEPNCLEKKITTFRHFPEVSLVYSDLQLIGKDIKNNGRYIDYLQYCRFVGKKLSKVPKDIFNILLLRNPVVSFSNIIVRSELLKDLILIKEHEIWSDWQLVVQASLVGKFFFVDEKLVKWRVHSKSYNNEFMKEADQKAQGAVCKVNLNWIIKEKIDKSQTSIVMKYLYMPLTAKYKLWQFFHSLGFAAFAPKVVFKEIIRKFQKKQLN